MSVVVQEGVFLVRAVDTYSPWASGLFLGLVEVVGLVYVYGATTIGKHFRQMLRSNVEVLVFAWRFLLLPIMLVSLPPPPFIANLVPLLFSPSLPSSIYVLLTVLLR